MLLRAPFWVGVYLMDIYNVTNSSVPLTCNGTYGATWLRPTAFMPARFVKVTGQFNF